MSLLALEAPNGPEVRVAVVGLGVGAAHVQAYRELTPAYRVVAVCDVDAVRAEQIQGKEPSIRSLDSLDDILATDEVDVVDLCTPPHLHFDQMVAALSAGKHVVCEKPLVGSLRQVDQLIELERTSRRRVMPIFQYRFGRGLQRLRALQAAGLASRCHTVSIDVAWSRGPWYYAAPWRGRFETELGGLLLSHCVHALDMATYTVGPARRAFARVDTRVNPVETEDCAAATIELGNGTLLSLSATLGSAEEITRHRFCFDGLVAESNLRPYTNSGDPWRFVTTEARSQEDIGRVMDGFHPEREGYERQLELAHPAFAGTGELPVTLSDAKASLGLVAGLYHSARHRVEVELPLGSDHPYFSGWQI